MPHPPDRLFQFFSGMGRAFFCKLNFQLQAHPWDMLTTFNLYSGRPISQQYAKVKQAMVKI